jgi:hypothetical protein
MLPCAIAGTVLTWPVRRLLTALVSAAATVLVIAVPTVLIPTPWFGRDVPPTDWAWPATIVTAVLAGLLTATYVRASAAPARGAPDELRLPTTGTAPLVVPSLDAVRLGPAGAVVTTLTRSDEHEDQTSHAPGTDAPSRGAVVGGILSFVAVGCPVCNKLALLALGYSGALAWFAPVQPYLAVAGIALLYWALSRRLRNDGVDGCGR